MKDTQPIQAAALLANLILLKLNLQHIKRIDEMLAEVGEYGEVHIIVQHGELRYINKVESYRLSDKEEKD